MDYKVAIVILNYLNYRDTEDCVDSLLNKQYSQVSSVVIVDNGSDNGSYNYLHNKYKAYPNIAVLKTHRNLGFAKGNNVGIKYARKKFATDFIFVVNNDTVFIDDQYFEKMLNKYEKGVGVIGSNIQLTNGKIQNEFTMYHTLSGIILNALLTLEYVQKRVVVKKILEGEMVKRPKRTILHGCALLFTPDFFKYYDGFFDKTFLYYEEMILAIMCESRNLLQVKQNDAIIYHKEDKSSELSFGNSMDVKRKYMRQSVKWLVLIKIKELIKEKILLTKGTWRQ